MSRKLRLFRILLIAFLVLFFAGYFAFATFLFNPLERSFKLDVSALVPRDVDFFLARSDLAHLFGRFPRLRAEDQFVRHTAWQTFRESREFADLDAKLGVQRALDELEAALSQVPGAIDVQEVYGGEDLALAGYFRPGGLEMADWAAYGRANWIGKLGESLLSYPALLDLEAQGLTAESKEGIVTLSGGTLPRPLSFGRVRDVVILGTSDALVKSARQLALEGGTESFFNSARYHDHVRNATRSPEEDELEFFVDIPRLLESIGAPGVLPDPESPFFGVALLARLFQLPSCKEAIGVLGMHGGVAIDVHAELSSEKVTRFQERLYRTRGADRGKIMTAASFAPADTCLFLYATLPVGDFLREMLESAVPAFRSNLDDLFRGSGRYSGIDEVVNLLDACLEGEFALIVRENDYRPEMAKNPQTGQVEYVGPPNDGQPVFAYSLLDWAKDAEKVEQFRDTLKNMDEALGLEGRTPAEPGVYQNTPGGWTTIEFWQRMVPGTGVITHLFDAPISLVSNTVPMPPQAMRTRYIGPPNYPRLSERPEFVALLDDSLKGSSANIVLWCDPPRAAPTLRKQADQWARDEAASRIDWVSLRAREEARLLPEIAPGKRRDALDEGEEERLASEVDAVLRSVREKEQTARFPEIRAEKERQIVYLESVTALLAIVRLDERRIDLGLRAVVPLPEAE